MICTHNLVDQVCIVEHDDLWLVAGLTVLCLVALGAFIWEMFRSINRNLEQVSLGLTHIAAILTQDDDDPDPGEEDDDDTTNVVPLIGKKRA